MSQPLTPPLACATALPQILWKLIKTVTFPLRSVSLGNMISYRAIQISLESHIPAPVRQPGQRLSLGAWTCAGLGSDMRAPVSGAASARPSRPRAAPLSTALLGLGRARALSQN